jgi:hypothetical protein
MASPLGWYVYTPQDLKKLKLTLRWACVQDYWLVLSTKPNEPPLLTLHLGLCQIRPATAEERADMKLPGLPVNTLLVQTDPILGDFPGGMIYLATHNRFDILDLDAALQAGKEAWDAFSTATRPESELTFNETLKDKKNSFLVTKNVDCSITPQGFHVSGPRPTDISNTEFDQILYLRPLPYESKQGNSIEMKVGQAGPKPDFVLECRDQNEMRRLLMIVYYYVKKFPKQAYRATI